MADQDRNQGADRADRRPDRPGTQGGRTFGKRSASANNSGTRDGKSPEYRGARSTSDGSTASRESQRGGYSRDGGDRGRSASSTGRSDRGSGSGGSSRGPRDESRGGAGKTDGAARPFNARDLRSANRPDRERSPNIDEDVTGAELDRVTRAQIRNLEEKSAEWVARHLVMAGRLLDEEPELAFQHALAASRRGGRLAVVREAVGLTAYVAGHYGEALREFRTYRRISGSNDHLPVMADCERGLGRPDRALDLARSEDATGLTTAGKVELAIVISGARSDLGQLDAAVAALEISQLDRNRAFSYSPRLFRAYADALEAVGRTTDAEQWYRQAAMADSALGIGDFTEPDIVDLGGEDDDAPTASAARRRVASAPESSPGVKPAAVRTGGNSRQTEDASPAEDLAGDGGTETATPAVDSAEMAATEPAAELAEQVAPVQADSADAAPVESERVPVTWRSLNRPSPIRTRGQRASSEAGGPARHAPPEEADPLEAVPKEADPQEAGVHEAEPQDNAGGAAEDGQDSERHHD